MTTELEAARLLIYEASMMKDAGKKFGHLSAMAKLYASEVATRVASNAIGLIGPEGGFSDSEYELANATGFNAIGFGARILRTETAAVAAIAALQTLFGDLAPD